MKVVVESLTGTLFYVQVNTDATVGDLKKEIGAHQKIPRDRLILILDSDGCRLMNHSEEEEEEERVLLNNCGVHDGSHIYLFFKPVDDESNSNYRVFFTLPDVLLG